MIKINTRVVVNMDTHLEFGIVTRTWKRQGVRYYDVKSEKGSLLEGLTTEPAGLVYINEELTNKLNNNKFKLKI